MDTPFKAFMDVRREELPLSLLMFSYFFLVITSFWILKPLKKALFIEYYDQSGVDVWSLQLSAAQAELLAKVMNLAVAFVAVIVFTALSRTLHRQQLTLVFSAFFIAGYLGFAAWLAEPADMAVWTFYLFGDLYSTLMVATFFAFLNDSMTQDSAKRLYGLIGLGGVSGGVFGSTVVRVKIESLSYADWLWLCIGIAVIIALVAMAAGRKVTLPPAPPAPVEKDQQASVATEGARLVFSSRYLLSIVAIVGLYEIISTIIDFQFTATIAHYLSGPAIGAQFALAYTITNWVSLLVQLFLTGLIMSRFGIGIALLVLPASIALGSSAFLLFPLLWPGTLLTTADNGFSYSINQSAKEALYVPTSAAEKYRAKAFIDMFVQRFAKAIAVVISLGLTLAFSDFESLRYLSFITLGLLVLWITAARYAGRQFQQFEAGQQNGEEPDPAVSPQPRELDADSP
jgi:AAA family ATP:ADP antiporter